MLALWQDCLPASLPQRMVKRSKPDLFTLFAPCWWSEIRSQSVWLKDQFNWVVWRNFSTIQIRGLSLLPNFFGAQLLFPVPAPLFTNQLFLSRRSIEGPKGVAADKCVVLPTTSSVGRNLDVGVDNFGTSGQWQTDEIACFFGRAVTNWTLAPMARHPGIHCWTEKL